MVLNCSPQRLWPQRHGLDSFPLYDNEKAKFFNPSNTTKQEIIHRNILFIMHISTLKIMGLCIYNDGT